MNHEFLLFRLQMLAVPTRYFKQNITSDRLLSSDLPVLSLIPSFSLPDVLCKPTDLIWRKGTPFEAMTGRTASSSDGLLAEVFLGFSSAVRQMPGDMCIAPRIISLSPLTLATDLTDATSGQVVFG